MAAHPESHELRSDGPGAGGIRNGRPRLALLVGFSSLFVLMVLAGMGALGVLRELHAEEEDVRQAFLARQQCLTILRSSVQTYSDRLDQYLFDDEGVDPREAGKELSGLLAKIESAIGNYPRQCPEEEQALLRAFAETLADQRSLAALVQKRDRVQRDARSARFLNDEVRPRQLRLSQTTERISVYVGQRLGAANEDLEARYSSLDSKMTRLLLASLGSALLLSLGSAVYILRLEREAQRRYGELAQSRLELQQLSERLVDAQEAERRSISRELHDEVGQALGAVLVDLGRVSARMPPGELPAKEQLDRIKGIVENTFQSVRNIALLLRPSMLDDLGLVAALEWQAREVSRRSQMEVDVRSQDISEDLPDEYKTCIYRLVQEALNNAARHAAARSAQVIARQTADRIIVAVKDDGRGFDPGKTRGMGILGMHERVKRLSGKLVIESQPGQGTVLTAELPLNTAGR